MTELIAGLRRARHRSADIHVVEDERNFERVVRAHAVVVHGRVPVEEVQITRRSALFVLEPAERLRVPAPGVVPIPAVSQSIWLRFSGCSRL